jgi:hypothetical protein
MAEKEIQPEQLRFTDTAGRPWDLKITLGLVNRLRKPKQPEAGPPIPPLDIPGLLNDGLKPLKKLLSDQFELMGWIWAIAAGQHPEVGLDDFAGSLDGDVLDAMANCFVNALADFSPPHRKILLVGLKMGKESQEKLVQTGTEKLLTMPDRLATVASQRMDRELDALMAELAGGSSTNGAPSPASIPETPSAPSP